MAGTGKRGDAKKPSINPATYFGKHGFTSIKKVKTVVKPINLYELSDLEAKDGVIDLTALGYTKLLGKGKVNAKLNVKVKQASKRALAAIEAAGGSVELLKPKVVKAPKPEAKPQEAKAEPKAEPKPEPKEPEQ